MSWSSRSCMADDKTGSSSIFMDSSWPRYGARAQMSSHTAFSRSHSFLPSISCLSTCSWWWVRGYNCSPFPPWRDKRRTSVMRFHSYSSAFLSATSCASLASLFAASSASFSFASWAFCSASANASSRSWVSMMLVHELRQQPVSRTVHHRRNQRTGARSGCHTACYGILSFSSSTVCRTFSSAPLVAPSWRVSSAQGA